MIYFWPNLDVITKVFRDLEAYWYDVVLGLKPFIADKLYTAFTRPIINGKKEDRICGYGPELFFFLEDNLYLHEIRGKIYDHLESNYIIAEKYLLKLYKIKEFYTEDAMTEEATIEEERELEKFRNMCLRYNEELATIESLWDWQPMGLYYLQMIEFKGLASPEPNRLIGIIERVMPS